MPVLSAERVQEVLRKGGSTRLAEPIAPKFQIGDQVIVRNHHPLGHTRAPRYVRGRRGTVMRDHGVFIFPDTHAAGLGKKPQHVYSVRFSANELWGPEAPVRDNVLVDLWDDYLDPA